MLFAFSRDGAVPGGRYWSQLNANRVPVHGVILSAVDRDHPDPRRRW